MLKKTIQNNNLNNFANTGIFNSRLDGYSHLKIKFKF